MIDAADVVVGLAWGDEAKGKITSHLAKTGNYDFVARWAGGNNAGHTVYVDGNKYKTHLVPSGVFYGVKSIVGPGCVLHPESFIKELEYLDLNGFDTSLVKVARNCHIVSDEHIEFDKKNLAGKLGTTSKGIAPAYSAKAARTGTLAEEIFSEDLLWDSNLHGTILCEGAQGVWLDINQGTYPFVTSSETLPYAACSIGFPPQKIRHIYGAAKIYDTRSGEDPLFPASLLDDPVLSRLGELGQEYGVTTGRRRKVNWLNLDMLIDSINMSGTTHVVVSKCDIIEKLGVFKILTGYKAAPPTHAAITSVTTQPFYTPSGNNKDKIMEFDSLENMKAFIGRMIKQRCPLVKEINFSYSPESI